MLSSRLWIVPNIFWRAGVYGFEELLMDVVNSFKGSKCGSAICEEDDEDSGLCRKPRLSDGGEGLLLSFKISNNLLDDLLINPLPWLDEDGLEEGGADGGVLEGGGTDGGGLEEGGTDGGAELIFFIALNNVCDDGS